MFEIFLNKKRKLTKRQERANKQSWKLWPGGSDAGRVKRGLGIALASPGFVWHYVARCVG